MQFHHHQTQHILLIYHGGWLVYQNKHFTAIAENEVGKHYSIMLAELNKVAL